MYTRPGFFVPFEYLYICTSFAINQDVPFFSAHRVYINLVFHQSFPALVNTQTALSTILQEQQ